MSQDTEEGTNCSLQHAIFRRCPRPVGNDFLNKVVEGNARPEFGSVDFIVIPAINDLHDVRPEPVTKLPVNVILGQSNGEIPWLVVRAVMRLAKQEEPYARRNSSFVLFSYPRLKVNASNHGRRHVSLTWTPAPRGNWPQHITAARAHPPGRQVKRLHLIEGHFVYAPMAMITRNATRKNNPAPSTTHLFAASASESEFCR